MFIFIGQPIYSLKDICLGGDTVEKPVIFGVQEGVLLKRGGLESKIRTLNCFNSAIEPPRYALSDFYRTAMIIYYGCLTARLRPIYSFLRMKLQFPSYETSVSHL